MALYCVGCGLEVIDGELTVQLDPSDCDHKILCGEDGLYIEHTLNRLVLRHFGDTHVVTPPAGLVAEEPWGNPMHWDDASSDVVDGTGLSHVGHTIVVERAGFYIITLNKRARANNIAEGVGEHMMNFNIRIDGVRRGGSIVPYAIPYSHRHTATMTSNLAAGQVIDAEFADQPIAGVVGIAWQLEGDSRNELSVTRLQSACPVPIIES